MPAYLPLGFEEDRYVPILLTRQGEMLALRDLDPDVKDAMTPMFVAHPVPSVGETGRPRCTEQEHVVGLVKRLTAAWGSRPAFVDLVHLRLGAPMPDGSHPLLWLVRECAQQGLPLAPVLSPARDADYRAAAAEVAAVTGGTLCFRLNRSEWIDLGRPRGDGPLMLLLSQTGLPPERVHLLLDCGDQVGDPAVTARAVEPVLQGLPRARDWASVTVAGTGMPVGTSAVGADNHALVPRTEWALWRRLDDPVYRRPSFGDYGVQHPDPQSGFDPKIMDTSAQLRYTVPGHWFVARGRGIKKHKLEQVRGLAAQVVALPAYAGPDFSWGDRWLSACADDDVKPGNQLVWRKVATTHHVTFVVRQLSTVLGT